MNGTSSIRRGKSVKSLCEELGMDRQTQKDFSKATLDYLKSEFDNLPNTTDEAIAPVSRQFVDAGRGSRWFSQKAALRYQWDNNQHREIIYGYINETMKTQRSYATDTLHHRVRRQQPADTPLNCPGCLLHPAGKTSTNSAIRYDDSDDPIDYGYSSDVSDIRSIHHITSRESSPETVNIKRPKTNHDYHVLSGGKKRERPMSITTDTNSVASMKKPRLNHEAQPSKRIASILSSPLKQDTPGFSPASPTFQTRMQPERPITLKYADASMRYRGKMWRFDSIAHKAQVLERILLREEQEVESYPIMAFSKGAQKAPHDPDDDDEGVGGNQDIVKDYFRFYTHFMNERFPGNERLLLENGVKPSA